MSYRSSKYGSPIVSYDEMQPAASTTSSASSRIGTSGGNNYDYHSGGCTSGSSPHNHHYRGSDRTIKTKKRHGTKGDVVVINHDMRLEEDPQPTPDYQRAHNAKP